jgi:DNA (cytosine-5)-methyltransferase 1
MNKDGGIIVSQKGATFTAFIRRLRRIGYMVDWKELRACDYGAPTIRKRLFMVARCDGIPIVWPDPTHGPGLLPYRTAAEIIDWTIPCQSIFDRKKPLAENTLRRIAEGIRRYVIEAAEPFIIPITHSGGGNRVHAINEPVRTITTAHRGELSLISYHIQRQFGQGVGTGINEPVGTVTAGGMGKTALVSAFLSKYYGHSIGQEASVPGWTSTTKNHHSLVTSHLLKLRGTSKAGQPVKSPLHTVTSGGNHIGEVRAFLLKYYGSDQAPKLKDPLHTCTTKDRFGLVMVNFHGQPYIITDIGMRMLSPRELFRAQGFTDDYKIDIEVNGKRITKTDQVRCCGNSVCPPIAAAIVKANCIIRNERRRYAG